jgi:hypothetical protein
MERGRGLVVLGLLDILCHEDAAEFFDCLVQKNPTKCRMVLYEVILEEIQARDDYRSNPFWIPYVREARRRLAAEKAQNKRVWEQIQATLRAGVKGEA